MKKLVIKLVGLGKRAKMSEVCLECNYPTWWVDNGCNKCGYEEDK